MVLTSLVMGNMKPQRDLGDGGDLLGDVGDHLGDGGELLGDGGDHLRDDGKLLGDGVDLPGDGPSAK